LCGVCTDLDCSKHGNTQAGPGSGCWPWHIKISNKATLARVQHINTIVDLEAGVATAFLSLEVITFVSTLLL